MKKIMDVIKVIFLFWTSCFILGFAIGKIFNSNPDKRTKTSRDKIEGVVALLPQIGIKEVAIKPAFEELLKNGNAFITTVVTISGIGIGYGGYCLGSGDEDSTSQQPALTPLVRQQAVVLDSAQLSRLSFLKRDSLK